MNRMMPKAEGAAAGLWADGYAGLGRLLDAETCRALRGLYGHEDRFRSHIDMARYRFGEGSYRYFAYPLPEAVAELRERLYAQLAPVANDWMKALGIAQSYSAALKTFLAQCKKGGQARPTPLLLHYEAGGYNCLHQD